MTDIVEAIERIHGVLEDTRVSDNRYQECGMGKWALRWVLMPKKLISDEWSDWSDLLALCKIDGEWRYCKPTERELQEIDMDRW